MDISSRFSLEDFLAYFFPGVAGTFAIYLLLLLTPLKAALVNISPDLATGVLLIVVCYIVGALLSGFAELSVNFIRHSTHWCRPRDMITMPEYSKAIIAAFQDTFNLPQKPEYRWSTTDYYLCRSLVVQYLPALAQTGYRQNSLRQLRMNLVPPLILWGVTGIAWGIWGSSDAVWGTVLVIGSIVSILMMLAVIFNRMHSNEEREVREILTAFLIGYQTDAFRKPNS